VNFLRSQILSITSYCRYFLPIKTYRHPALKVFALASAVYDASAIFAAKIQNLFENITICHKIIHNLIVCATERVKLPWNSLAIAKWFGSFSQCLYLCTKKMDKKAIENILKSEEMLERFVETLVDEVNNDDEAYDKKGRQLLELCLTDENADDFFIAICGWSVDSLMNKMGNQ